MQLHEMSQQTHDRLVGSGLDPNYVADIIRHTIAEDLDGGIDVTSVATVPLAQRSIATFGARAHGCVAGLDIAAAVIEMVCGASASSFEYKKNDGDRVVPGDVLAQVEAPTQFMLTAERTALNLLCHLSGVATATAQWVDAIAGTTAIIRDTRKTTPGLRALEKYAVRCGGGQNHRMSLSDAALVKDNHIVAAGGVAEAFEKVRALAATLPIENSLRFFRAGILPTTMEVADRSPPDGDIETDSPNRDRYTLSHDRSLAAEISGKRCDAGTSATCYAAAEHDERVPSDRQQSHLSSDVLCCKNSLCFFRDAQGAAVCHGVNNRCGRTRHRSQSR